MRFWSSVIFTIVSALCVVTQVAVAYSGVSTKTALQDSSSNQKQILPTPPATKYIIQASDTLYVYFKVGDSEILPAFSYNNESLNSLEKLIGGGNSLRYTFDLQNITLQGSASPEGKVRWNKILAGRRADAVSSMLKNKWSVNESHIVKENIELNHGANYCRWPELRSTRVIVGYSKISKDDLIPQSGWSKSPEAECQMQSTHAQITSPVYGTDWKLQSSEVDRLNFRIALKSNLLYDLLLTPNIGVEIPLHEKWSLAANWMYAWWKSDSKSWYHRIYGGDVEIRRWIKPKSPLTGLHFGAYGQMLTYDFEWGGDGVLGDKWSWAAGISAGYSKKIAPRLNLDFTLGVGYLTGKYHEYKPVDDCYVSQATKNSKWFGPTKAEVTLVWLLGRW